MNQNPEQHDRGRIDHALLRSSWIVQSYKQKYIAAILGVFIREYPTDTGPADYILFVSRKPVGVIEDKRPEEGVRLTVFENQSNEYATANMNYIYTETLSIVYESTGEVTRFTDYRDPKPSSRSLFAINSSYGNI